MFIDAQESEDFVTGIYNEVVKAEKTGVPGEEKEKRVLDAISKLIQDPVVFPGLVALFGPTKMIPLALFSVQVIIKILNAALGHKWIDRAENIKKDPE